MSKGVIKAVIFSAIFLVAVILFSFAMNHTNEDLTTEMKEASLPVVSFSYQDRQMNELFGYSEEMEASYMRDSITPINTDRILPMKIQTYGYSIDAISYEIRSMDTSRLIADSDVTEYSNERGVIRADLEIENLLEECEEYLFILRIQSGEKTICYYTRIVEPADCYVKESLDFVMDFHEKSFSKEAAAALATYVEPNATGDNSSLAHVTIHSTLNQIAWADFKGQRLLEPVVSIKEINTSYNVIMLDYVMASEGENGELEYYNTREYFRVRHTSDRMYLLNYERTMNQIFRGENASLYANRIQLGIRDGDIQYVANETGNIVCFVQEGELWSYNAQEGRLSQVFSFRGYEGIDDRENNGNHEIRIIKVNESGSADFVVYGYMNRGNHEGEVGICVYHYDSVANTVEEELFLPFTRSYQIMKAQMGQMMYESEANKFYLILESSLYEIDMNTMEYKEMRGGLEEGAYAVSESRRYVAYLEGKDKNRGSSICILDLEMGESFQIDADSGEYVRPLGFMEDDFIYGTARASDVVEDAVGNTVFPMYSVRIVDMAGENHSILKEYKKDGYYVSDIEVADYTIYLNRIQYNGVAYVDVNQDTIMNREADTEGAVEVDTTVMKEKQTRYQLVLKSQEQIEAKKLLTPKQIVLTKPKSIALNINDNEDYYYSYARGEVLAVTKDVAEAISVANENMGVVIGAKQQYIWKRAKKAYQRAIEVTVGEADASGSSMAKNLSAMLGLENLKVSVQGLLDRGDTPKAVLNDTMQDMTVLDLVGCELDEVLYYVNRGTPVFAMTSQDETVLLTGYDASTVTLFDSGVVTRKTLEEAKEMFSQAGNIFFAYLKE